MEQIFTYFPTYGPFIAIVLFVLTIIERLTNTYKGLSLPLPGNKRNAIAEDLNFIKTQLEDPDLTPENREMLKTRRTELLLALIRGVDLPEYMIQPLLNLSTEKNPQGLKWALIRQVQENITYKDNKIFIDLRLWEIIVGIIFAVLAFVAWAFIPLAIFTIAYSPPGALESNTIVGMIITVIIALVGGYVFTLDALRVWLSHKARNKIKELEKTPANSKST